MLLAVDVGNTQIAIGLFQDAELVGHWRIATRRDQTEDELAAIFKGLFDLSDIRQKEVTDIAIASVVPSSTAALTAFSRKYFAVDPFVVEPGVETGISVKYDNPDEVGADRIVNAVAGFERYGGPLIIVDFGTATTFDAISEAGEYLGGAIAPGILVSAEALFSRAARLHRIDLIAPERAIGRDTASSIQAGVLFGTAGMVDSLVGRIVAELGEPREVIATGGLAELVSAQCGSLSAVEPYLTLEGLKLVYRRNSK
ncbi:MAG: type III pantothenate kinase [Chloroflexi bacterium]|nr:type III pantothenate kinase [Chloroflexota bacterium]